MKHWFLLGINKVYKKRFPCGIFSLFICLVKQYLWLLHDFKFASLTCHGTMCTSSIAMANHLWYSTDNNSHLPVGLPTPLHKETINFFQNPSDTSKLVLNILGENKVYCLILAIKCMFTKQNEYINRTVQGPSSNRGREDNQPIIKNEGSCQIPDVICHRLSLIATDDK